MRSHFIEIAVGDKGMRTCINVNEIESFTASHDGERTAIYMVDHGIEDGPTTYYANCTYDTFKIALEIE